MCTSDYWGGPDAHEIFVHGVVPPEFVMGLHTCISEQEFKVHKTPAAMPFH